ncbi:MAG: DUF3576 domain-containing protein [Alphaproteobacteria bacterium]
MNKLLPSIAIASLLAACSGDVVKYEEDDTLNRKEQRDAKVGKMFGEDFLTFGGEKKDNGGSGIGVNKYLWRASLDTVSFMPISKVDPFGGVILTEWYTPPNTPNERVKVDIFILDRVLRADGVRVSLHKQRLNKRGVWEDTFVDPHSFSEFEEAILTRARQLKINQG